MLLVLGSLGFADDSLMRGFKNVPNESRMRMFWRLFGPAWTPTEIDYQLRVLKGAGVGGVTAFFMYPVELDNPTSGIHNQVFGSPEFLKTFGYASKQAAQVGIRFGVCGGTGWPYGGPTVTLKDAAMRLFRQKDTPDLKLAEGESVIWRPGDGSVYIQGPCGMKVKRPANGADGWVVSHFDSGALNRYLSSVVHPMIAEGGVKGLFCDSLEVYASNWCADMPEEFKKRRGYDLLPHLHDLFASGGAVRFDFWRTLMELTEERFTRPLGQFAKRSNVPLEMEAYGTPPNPMTCYRYIDIPTGEHYEWKGFSVQKYVSSAANLCGKAFVGSEAWTWAGLPNRLADTLSDLKLVSDMAFLGGANDLTGVDYPYSPRSAGSPGWQPYYGPTMNQNNPLWLVFPSFVEYINRCQWLLRQGTPVRDIAVYLPVEDAISEGPAEQMLLDFYVRDRLVTGKATSEFGLQNSLKHQSDLVHGLIKSGFDYDGIDLFAMQRLARVANGRLKAGMGSYKALVLPNLNSMDVASAEKALSFCKSGGVVVASRQIPKDAAGLVGDSKRLAEIMVEMFGKVPQVDVWHVCGRGKALLVPNDSGVGPVLKETVGADVQYEVTPESVGFVHRQTSKQDIYFFANTSMDPVSICVRLPKQRFASIWDAKSGLAYSNIGSKATLDLDGRGSLFLVIDKANRLLPGPKASPVEAFRESLEGTWRLTFEGPDAPKSVDMNWLVSWTDLPSAKFFSGIGTYQTTFQVREPLLVKRVFLEFDAIRDAAVVRVNGDLAGTLWCPPNRIEIGSLLKRGVNKLEVQVANLIVNRFIGQPDIDLKPLRAIYGGRFPAPEEKQLMKEPAPSGIIGKVSLVVY